MSHAIKAAAVDQIAFFRAYDTDGTAKVNLTSATAGLALSVFRIGASAVSISSLSDKAADNTAHADGAIRQIQGNLYTVDLPDAAQATQVASICVKGTYTGGVIEGVPHPIVGYDGTATAVGANTTAPDNATITLIQAKTTNLPSDPADQSLIIAATDAVMARLGAPAGASVSADIAGVQTGVTTLLGRITSTLFSGITSLGDWLRRLARKDAGTAGMIAAEVEIDTGGTSTFTGTTDSLESLADASGGGTGARTVTITVNDGAAALQNARVRLTEGANTYVATTNVSGVATFNVDDATYTVAITKSGYTYAGTTLVVNGDEAATYSMTETVVTPPSNPSLSAIEVLCLGAHDTAESGIDVDFRIVTIPSGDQNKSYSGTKKTVTSDEDGIARIEVAQGSTYEYKRGVAQVWNRVTVDADGVTNVTSFIGSP